MRPVRSATHSAPAVRGLMPSWYCDMSDNILSQISIPMPCCLRPISMVRSFALTLVSLSGLVLSRPGRTTLDSRRCSACTSCLTFGETFSCSCILRVLNGLNRVNHWLVLITFLQHTDPLIPHYRSEVFTYPRGALATFDRNFLGDLGSFMSWIGSTATHGASETHVVHHVSSRIPHYNACVPRWVTAISFTDE